jgi:hypothetical protein
MELSEILSLNDKDTLNFSGIHDPDHNQSKIDESKTMNIFNKSIYKNNIINNFEQSLIMPVGLKSNNLTNICKDKK